MARIDTRRISRLAMLLALIVPAACVSGDDEATPLDTPVTSSAATTTEPPPTYCETVTATFQRLGAKASKPLLNALAERSPKTIRRTFTQFASSAPPPLATRHGAVADAAATNDVRNARNLRVGLSVGMAAGHVTTADLRELESTTNEQCRRSIFGDVGAIRRLTTPTVTKGGVVRVDPTNFLGQNMCGKRQPRPDGPYVTSLSEAVYTCTTRGRTTIVVAGWRPGSARIIWRKDVGRVRNDITWSEHPQRVAVDPFARHVWVAQRGKANRPPTLVARSLDKGSRRANFRVHRPADAPGSRLQELRFHPTSGLGTHVVVSRWSRADGSEVEATHLHGRRGNVTSDIPSTGISLGPLVLTTEGVYLRRTGAPIVEIPGGSRTSLGNSAMCRRYDSFMSSGAGTTTKRLIVIRGSIASTAPLPDRESVGAVNEGVILESTESYDLYDETGKVWSTPRRGVEDLTVLGGLIFVQRDDGSFRQLDPETGRSVPDPTHGAMYKPLERQGYRGVEALPDGIVRISPDRSRLLPIELELPCLSG